MGAASMIDVVGVVFEDGVLLFGWVGTQGEAGAHPTIPT